MEQQKSPIDIKDFHPLRVKLRPVASTWVHNQSILKPMWLQSLGSNGTLITIEIRQMWNTQRYSMTSLDRKIIRTSIHTSIQNSGCTKWLPVLSIPLEF